MADVTEMLTRAEAILYLTDVLKIKEVENKIKELDLSLLNEIIHQHNLVNPFTNIDRFLSIPKDDRCLPSLSEVKNSMFARLGGLCYEHNVFMHNLFGVLGYKVEFYLAAVLNFNPSHILAIVTLNEDLTDIKYLVDVGVGNPFFQAVPLNFEQESVVYHNCYHRFKYYKKEGKIVQTILPRQYVQTEAPAEEWMDLYAFEPNAITREEMVKVRMGALYRYDKEEKLSSFHFHISLIGFYEGKGVRFTDKKYELEEQDGIMRVYAMDSEAKKLEAINRFFPQFNKEVVRRALVYMREVEKGREL